MPVVHFLLVYDRARGKLVTQRPFNDARKAVDAYERAELEHRHDRNIEIVLVGADSLKSIMLTHGNYFDAVPSASPYLQGV
ncbi:MAG: hypothetical protein JHD16_06835 [Solirubrobacteraceae bacterium]|nr:hypothetical protein [Solirubrobacteraceae bacterium]